jgi:hypothetical protein
MKYIFLFTEFPAQKTVSAKHQIFAGHGSNITVSASAIPCCTYSTLSLYLSYLPLQFYSSIPISDDKFLIPHLHPMLYM